MSGGPPEVSPGKSPFRKLARTGKIPTVSTSALLRLPDQSEMAWLFRQIQALLGSRLLAAAPNFIKIVSPAFLAHFLEGDVAIQGPSPAPRVHFDSVNP